MIKKSILSGHYGKLLFDAIPDNKLPSNPVNWSNGAFGFTEFTVRRCSNNDEFTGGLVITAYYPKMEWESGLGNKIVKRIKCGWDENSFLNAFHKLYFQVADILHLNIERQKVYEKCNKAIVKMTDKEWNYEEKEAKEHEIPEEYNEMTGEHCKYWIDVFSKYVG